jgi:hypothetical protein
LILFFGSGGVQSAHQKLGPGVKDDQLQAIRQNLDSACRRAIRQIAAFVDALPAIGRSNPGGVWASRLPPAGYPLHAASRDTGVSDACA